MATKQKPKGVRRNAVDRLLSASNDYLKLRGGEAIVAGPIGITTIQSLSPIPEFFLMVKIMGRMPTKPEPGR